MKEAVTERTKQMKLTRRRQNGSEPPVQEREQTSLSKQTRSSKRVASGKEIKPKLPKFEKEKPQRQRKGDVIPVQSTALSKEIDEIFSNKRNRKPSTRSTAPVTNNKISIGKRPFSVGTQNYFKNDEFFDSRGTKKRQRSK